MGSRRPSTPNYKPGHSSMDGILPPLPPNEQTPYIKCRHLKYFVVLGRMKDQICMPMASLFGLVTTLLPLPSPQHYKCIRNSLYVISFQELWTRNERPYANFNSFTQFCEEVIDKGHRPEISNDIPSDLAQLIQRCWHKDSAHRYIIFTK